MQIHDWKSFKITGAAKTGLGYIERASKLVGSLTWW
jgi:hypothetical protein